MLPSEFKAIKALAEMLRTGLSAIKEAIQNQERACRDGQKSTETQWSKVPGIITSAIRPTQNEISHAQARDDQSYRQQERAIQIQRRLVVATWCAFGAAFLYAGIAAVQGYLIWRTYKEIQAQTKAAQWSQYMACLNARVAQAMFIQAQNSAGDSHVMAESAVQQAASQIASERAMINLIPRIPAIPGEAIGTQLQIPYSIKNDGKSPAVDVDLWFKAMLLEKNQVLSKDALRVSKADKESVHQTGKYVSAGNDYPGKVPEGEQRRPSTPLINVSDAKGNPVLLSSHEAADFLNNGAAQVFVSGESSYKDFAGTHRQKFCIRLGTVPSGTMSIPNPNEGTCYSYNKSNDEYPNKPQINIPAKITPPVQIECAVPPK